jgi:hypothetical protein
MFSRAIENKAAIVRSWGGGKLLRQGISFVTLQAALIPQDHSAPMSLSRVDTQRVRMRNACTCAGLLDQSSQSQLAGSANERSPEDTWCQDPSCGLKLVNESFLGCVFGSGNEVPVNEIGVGDASLLNSTVFLAFAAV